MVSFTKTLTVLLCLVVIYAAPSTDHSNEDVASVSATETRFQAVRNAITYSKDTWSWMKTNWGPKIQAFIDWVSSLFDEIKTVPVAPEIPEITTPSPSPTPFMEETPRSIEEIPLPSRAFMTLEQAKARMEGTATGRAAMLKQYENTRKPAQKSMTLDEVKARIRDKKEIAARKKRREAREARKKARAAAAMKKEIMKDVGSLEFPKPLKKSEKTKKPARKSMTLDEVKA